MPGLYFRETAIKYDFLVYLLCMLQRHWCLSNIKTKLIVVSITVMAFSLFGRCDSQGAGVVRTGNPATLEQTVLRDQGGTDRPSGNLLSFLLSIVINTPPL